VAKVVGLALHGEPLVLVASLAEIAGKRDLEG
jgi:hypothetical protein